MKHKITCALAACALALSGCASITPAPETIEGAHSVLSSPNQAVEKIVDGGARIIHQEVADTLAEERSIVGCRASATDILGSVGKAIGVLALTTTPTAIPALLSLGADWTACAAGVGEASETSGIFGPPPEDEFYGEDGFDESSPADSPKPASIFASSANAPRGYGPRRAWRDSGR